MPYPKDPIRVAELKKLQSERNKKNGIRPPSRLGVKQTQEQKNKISASLKAIGHMPPSALGLKRSERTKEKISQNHSHYWLGVCGKDAPGYIDGRSPLISRIRNSKKYKQWRTAVFERDSYRCQHCNQRGGYLEADHIKPFYILFEELKNRLGHLPLYKDVMNDDSFWNISNGRALCKKEHRLTETYGKKVYNLKKLIMK